ncbi:MAG TPA: alpha/beta fold hydrolase [Acidimicrobiales bacterium]
MPDVTHPHELRGWRVDVRGVGIWAELHGPPDAVPVVLVHRMAAQGFEWPDALIDALLDAGYCVLTYDHRGFGWSDLGPTDESLAFQDLVDDAAGVLRAFGITHAHLVGSSVGGVIARCLALQVPGLARTLTFIGSSPGDGTLPVWSPEYTAVAMNPPGPSFDERVDYLVRELRVMSDARFDEDAARRRATRAVRRGWTLDALRRTVRAAKGRSQGERDLAALASIDVPSLVVHGTGDHVLGAEHGRALAAAIPGATLVVVDGMGHEVQDHYVPVILEHLLPMMAAADAL